MPRIPLDDDDDIVPEPLRKLKLKNDKDVELAGDYWYTCTRDNFWAYRKFINPDLIEGWWLREAAYELELFYKDLKAGKRPVLLLQAPRQHGKSFTITDFISWVAGHDPDMRAIFASYSDALGHRANLALQRIYNGPRYQMMFPYTRIGSTSEAAEMVDSRQTLNLFEYVDRKGSFRNTTVSGRVTGEGLDLGILDDPLKDSAAASSQLIRDKTWHWLTDDFMPCFAKNAGFLLIMTRYHLDDPAGRLLERLPQAKVVKFEAIATKDERYRKQGEPLFPEFKPLDFLIDRKSTMTQAGWEAEFQQSPIIVGGGMFPIANFKIEQSRPPRDQVRKIVRYWDKAGTHGDGAYSVGVRMEQLKDKRFIVTDVVRGQWGAFDREQRILQTAQIDNSDGWAVDTWVEQEPGSGGKESAERTIVNLAGFNIRRDRVKGNKELRAEPYAAQVQGGTVSLLGGLWNRAFLDEHEQFPNGKYKDQVDAAGGAFSRLVSQRFDGQLPAAFGLPAFYEGEQRIF